MIRGSEISTFANEEKLCNVPQMQNLLDKILHHAFQADPVDGAYTISTQYNTAGVFHTETAVSSGVFMILLWTLQIGCLLADSA